MKLYGNPASTCTRRVLAVAAEKNASVELITLDFARGEHKLPDHFARQPFGVVPALDDDGFVLYESRAIMRYLDELLPGVSLTPSSVADRARMEQWISVEYSYFSGTVMKAVLEIWYASMRGDAPDPEVVAAGVKGAERALDVLEEALADREFLVGELSLADITFAPYLQYMQDMGIDAGVKARPNVAAWWARVSGRPAWQRAIGRA